MRTLLILFTLPAAAQSLDALVREALSNNREILAAQKRYEAARQRPAQQSSMPDPMVSLGYTSNGNPLPGAGLGRDMTSNVGLMVSQEMPFPGKLRLRGEIAQKEADAGLQEYERVRRSVISKLKQAYHELHHSYEMIASMRQSQSLLQNMMRVSEARYSVGRAAQQDIFRAQTQYSIMETQIVRAEQEKLIKEAEINALLNREPGAKIEVPGQMRPGELSVALDELLSRARVNAPELRKDEKTIQRNELAVNLAKKNFYPDYTLSGGYFNQGGLPPMYQFRVDVKLPIHLGRQRAELTEQANMLRESQHMYENDARNVSARIEQDYRMAETAHKLMDLYTKSVIPQAELTLESATASYQTGALDFISLFGSFMTLVDYRLAYHDEMKNFHLALARLEEMSGVELDGGRQ